MSKYWFYNIRTLEVITVVASSIDEATTKAKQVAGHNYVSLCSAASV